MIQEMNFAEALIKYVQRNPETSLKAQKSETLPDHWTYSFEGNQFLVSCLVHHGLFDSVFSRETLIPKTWSKFEKQYLSPEMHLLERIYDECQLPRIEDIAKAPEKMEFHWNKDFWTKATQSKTYEELLSKLDQRGAFTQPTREYKMPVTGVSVGAKVIDLPLRYGDLQLVFGHLEMGMPQPNEPIVDRYGPITPVAFMIADSFPEEGLHETFLEFIRLLKKGTGHGEPKYQDIMYVLAEKKGNLLTPQFIGNMHAYGLEQYENTPTGKVKWDYPYAIPPRGYTVKDEDRKYWCDREKWKSHYLSFLQRHPSIAKMLPQEKLLPR